MKQPKTLARFVSAAIMVCAMLLSCGLTVFAAENPMVSIKVEHNPADVQAIVEDGERRIIKTYILTAEENPADIPRASFTEDCWLYEFADITEERTSGIDARHHVETVELETESDNLDELINLLAPVLEYESADGYCGILTPDLASVRFEAAGHENSSYTVTATREYSNLPANDLYHIPKTITDSGRTLALDNVNWEVQSTVKAGYSDIPSSYRAIATYTGKATRSIATGYVATAEYTGEISKETPGDTAYKVSFNGAEINPAPDEAEPTAPTPTPDRESGSTPIALIVCGVIIALLAGAATFFFLRHNVKVYIVEEDGYHALAGKDRIRMKNPVIDLTPLDGRSESRCFIVEIDKLAAKFLNGKTVSVLFGSKNPQHKIAYEGNAYRIEADFDAGTIKAVY